MKLKVPFYAQQSKNDCGPTALFMVLEYFGKECSRDKLQNLVDSDKSGVTWTLALATAAATLGFRASFFTVTLGFNLKNYELEFYQKLADSMDSSEKKLDHLKREAVKLHVDMQEKTLLLEEILEKVSMKCIPIVLLDWGIITGRNKFSGHFVPIVGYDQENVYVHNQDFSTPQSFLSIKRSLFDAAQKAVGTDEDIVFIYKK